MHGTPGPVCTLTFGLGFLLILLPVTKRETNKVEKTKTKKEAPLSYTPNSIEDLTQKTEKDFLLAARFWSSTSIFGIDLFSSLSLVEINTILVKTRSRVGIILNYRPISILSAIPKLLEKVMCDQLYDVFKSKFSLNMSGFLRGHSCCTALLKMVDDWWLALDSKKITGSIAIDLSKAFNSICHNLLLAKRRAYGLNDDAIHIAFLQSYLTDRQQKGQVSWEIFRMVSN